MTFLKKTLFLLLVLVLSGCRNETSPETDITQEEGTVIPVEHAIGFSLADYGRYKILSVNNPWPGAERSYRYLLTEEDVEIPENLDFDQKITIPVERMVVTSTTHISSLEILNEEESLVGFPGLDYISSANTRSLISRGRIKELGQNESINTEVLLELEPDVVIGFSVDGSNKTFNTIQNSGIPVVFNADWTETSPLGKAEWIKFFGAFFNKTSQAAEFFEEVRTAYREAQGLAAESEERPTVLAGSMYKDQWFLPAGDSWHARFIEDANANYLYSDSRGTGSLTLSLESVIAEAQDADYWIGPAQFTTYEELRQASPHYTRFDAFQNRNIYTFSSEKGETGGVIFYEVGPLRPDLVLKDLISIFHPELLPGYETTFYKSLQ